MIEETIIVGKSKENTWRRDNLLRVRNCVDKGTYYEASFQWIDHPRTGPPIEVRITYHILK
jgi:hypothetical protein